MAHAKFKVEILTPDGEVFNDEVEQVSTRTALGEIGILAGHEPVLATLDPTELRLYVTESEVVRFAQAEGYLQITKDGVMLLVEEAHSPDQLDAAALRERLDEAERELEAAGDDSEKRRVAFRDVRRTKAFLKITDAS